MTLYLKILQINVIVKNVIFFQQIDSQQELAPHVNMMEQEEISAINAKDYSMIQLNLLIQNVTYAKIIQLQNKLSIFLLIQLKYNQIYKNGQINRVLKVNGHKIRMQLLKLEKKCITRDLKWGVQVPVEGFQKKVFYVWFDALIGYISITANYLQEQYKNWWLNPENVKLYQFMGKDNIPFHTVMFPSSLIASQQKWTLLHHISTTEYLNYEKGKFSKSRATGVFGDSAQETGIPSEVWRYYLLINRPQKSDSKFSWTDFRQKNNNELLANIGNLCNRVLQFSFSNYKIIPKISYKDLNETDIIFVKLIQEKFEKYNNLLLKVQIKEGLKIAMQISSIGNKYIQDSQPWQKINIQNGRSPVIIGLILNFIRFISVLIEPYMPSTSAKINFLLGTDIRIARDSQLISYLKSGNFGQILLTLIQNSSGLRQPCHLFKKITEQQQNQWREKFKGEQIQQVLKIKNPKLLINNKVPKQQQKQIKQI